MSTLWRRCSLSSVIFLKGWCCFGNSEFLVDNKNFLKENISQHILFWKFRQILSVYVCSEGDMRQLAFDWAFRHHWSVIKFLEVSPVLQWKEQEPGNQDKVGFASPLPTCQLRICKLPDLLKLFLSSLKFRCKDLPQSVVWSSVCKSAGRRGSVSGDHLLLPGRTGLEHLRMVVVDIGVFLFLSAG